MSFTHPTICNLFERLASHNMDTNTLLTNIICDPTVNSDMRSIAVGHSSKTSIMVGEIVDSMSKFINEMAVEYRDLCHKYGVMHNRLTELGDTPDEYDYYGEYENDEFLFDSNDEHLAKAEGDDDDYLPEYNETEYKYE